MKSLNIIVFLTTLSHCAQLALAAPATGRVIGWGSNIGGQATGTPTPVLPNAASTATGAVMIAGRALDKVVAVSAGHAHALALRADGTVIGWGWNPGGQAVGFTTEPADNASGPVSIAGRALTGVTALAAGRTHSLALKSNGTVVAFGLNQFGETAVPEGLKDVVALSASWDQSLALRRDGTVVCWGLANTTPVSVSNAVAIAAGPVDYSDALALRSDGTVAEWPLFRGRGDPAPAGLTNVVAISAGWGQYLALRRDGTVFGWGANGSGQATGIPTTNAPYTSAGVVKLSGQILSNVLAIAAGNDLSLAVRKDGTITTWGRPPYAWMGLPPGLSNVVAVAAGEHFCLAITTNGPVDESAQNGP